MYTTSVRYFTIYDPSHCQSASIMGFDFDLKSVD